MNPLLAKMETTLTDGLVLMSVGMVVVFIALTTLLGIITLIQRWQGGHRAAGADTTAAAPASAPAAVAAAGREASSQNVTPELLAVITAAAMAVMNRPLRVRRIRFIGRSSAQHSWVAQGRSGIMSSHRPHLHKSTARKK